MTRFSICVLSILLCLILSNCASILNPSQTLTLSSSPEGAEAYVGDNYAGTTPCSYKTRSAPKEISFRKPGYIIKTIEPDKKFNPMVLTNFFSGAIGFVVDILNGTHQKYGNTNYFATLNMAPSDNPLYHPLDPNVLQERLEMTGSLRINNVDIKPLIPKSNNNKTLNKNQIFDQCNPGVFVVKHRYGQGSGFFISSDGIAVSNFHVFKGADINDIRIKLYNGQVYSIDEILAGSEEQDYIVFRVKGHFSFVPVSSRGYHVGDDVYAIGSPLGLENTFSSGEISALRTKEGFIQISVPIDHGSSGGVLINKFGEAIGITSAGFDKSGANLNFAIDINVIFSRQ